MLRAIQLMGWPLDAIVSVDIWFDDETPAELPPMVAFKDEWDKKCLDWFGLPVTHLCAEKRSQIGKVEREDQESRMTRSVTHASLTQATSTNKLTYVDIFYRPMKPKAQERERERRRREHPIYGYPQQRGAWCNSDLKQSALRFPKQSMPLVYRGTQAGSIKGFPWRKGAWCQDRLKGNNLDRVF